MSSPSLDDITKAEYKAGFVTDIEQETLPARPVRGRRAPHLGEEGRAGVDARVAAQGLPALAHDGGADAGRTSTTRRSTTRRSRTTPRRSSRRRAEEPRRGGPEAARDLREARHPARTSGSCSPGSRWTPSSTASRWPPRSGRSSRRRASIFCSFSEAVREHPELVRQYLGTVVPHTDNFFAALNSAVFSDGSFVYVPKGVRCPMELSTYFRINAAQHRAVRADPDRRRGGGLRQLPRGLHGADARREPAARRGGRAGRARRRADQVLDRPELVPGRRGRQGRDLQLRDQARQVRGAALQDLLDPGRDRLRHHLEVPQLHPAGRRLGGRVLLGRRHQQHAAGGHRHQDDPPGEEHPQHDRLEGHLRRPRAEHLPRASCGSARGPTPRATTPSATRC